MAIETTVYPQDGLDCTQTWYVDGQLVRLTLVRNMDGDGGWSLHDGDATDEEIAEGDAAPLLSGPAVRVEYDDARVGTGWAWSAPTRADVERAARALLERE